MKKLLAVATTCVFLGSATTALAQGLVQGDADAGKQKSATCAACHGADGNSTSPEFPKLAGQHATYIVKQLRNFKAGSDPESTEVVRMNPTMNGMAAPLSEQDMQDLAVYFENQTMVPGEADPDLVDLGRQIYQGGNMATGVPACMACHSPTGLGNTAAAFPRLAGQHAQYMEAQLKAFRAGQRANDPGQMMRNAAARMTDEEIKAVASYIQGLR